MHFKLDSQALQKDKLYGTTTVGAKGQVVIPVQARKDLGIEPGDHLLVLGKLGKALGLIKAEQLEELIFMFLSQLQGSEDVAAFKAHIESVFGSFKSKGSRKSKSRNV